MVLNEKQKMLLDMVEKEKHFVQYNVLKGI